MCSVDLLFIYTTLIMVDLILRFPQRCLSSFCGSDTLCILEICIVGCMSHPVPAGEIVHRWFEWVELLIIISIWVKFYKRWRVQQHKVKFPYFLRKSVSELVSIKDICFISQKMWAEDYQFIYICTVVSLWNSSELRSVLSEIRGELEVFIFWGEFEVLMSLFRSKIWCYQERLCFQSS